jgi:hypothetical protein
MNEAKAGNAPVEARRVFIVEISAPVGVGMPPDRELAGIMKWVLEEGLQRGVGLRARVEARAWGHKGRRGPRDD